MKAPIDRVSYNLASFLSIRLADAVNTAKIEKRLKPTEGGDIEDIHIQRVIQEQTSEEREIKVMVIGKLENPRI